jgi:hypothetical protein
MKLRQKVRRALKSDSIPESSKMPQRRIVVFGDSHIHAIQEAIRHRKARHREVRVEALRLLKEKNNKIIGDTSFEAILDIVRGLSANDIFVTVIGGNQHAVFSTIQHPAAFDFLLPGDSPDDVARNAELIPFRTLHDYFVSGIRSGDLKSIKALREATSAHVVHLLAPPPKGDNAFIEDYHDTRFAEEDIASLGVSSPALRMRFWRLQNLVIEEFCAELGIETLGPPAAARDPNGFLDRVCYANDATHANAEYGELVLQQLEAGFCQASGGVLS